MLLCIVQVIMMFAQPFWPDGFFDVVCTDSFIPEFWVTDPPLTPSQPQPASATTALQDVDKPQHAQQEQSAPVHCMVGFVAGSRAEEISKLRQNSVIIKTLSQLDQMFGKTQLFACSGTGSFSKWRAHVGRPSQLLVLCDGSIVPHKTLYKAFQGIVCVWAQHPETYLKASCVGQCCLLKGPEAD